MKNLNILRKLIQEELNKVLLEGENAMDNYMFFQNLQTINKATSEMLQMDPQYVDAILSDGHQWAVDHIATSADDVSEVHGFLMNRQPMMESDDDEIFKPLRPDENSDLILGNIVEHANNIAKHAGELLEWNLGLAAKLRGIESTLSGVESALRGMVANMDQASDKSNQAGNDDLYEKRLTKADKGYTSKFDNDPKLTKKQRGFSDFIQGKILKSK